VNKCTQKEGSYTIHPQLWTRTSEKIEDNSWSDSSLHFPRWIRHNCIPQYWRSRKIKL